jgi:hypothetical protein
MNHAGVVMFAISNPERPALVLDQDQGSRTHCRALTEDDE